MRPRRRILIVDDAGPIVVQCINALQALGYVVRGASNGEMALDQLQKESFDLALVDYRMPGMNGFELFEQARVLRSNMSFILITGHGSSDVIEEAIDLGFDSVLLKPFTRDQLRGAVENALRGAA